jgi:hypothetical protein
MGDRMGDEMEGDDLPWLEMASNPGDGLDPGEGHETWR